MLNERQRDQLEAERIVEDRLHAATRRMEASPLDGDWTPRPGKVWEFVPVTDIRKEFEARRLEHYRRTGVWLEITLGVDAPPG